MKNKMLYLNDEEYKKFQIQSILIGKSVSQRIGEFIRNELKKEEEKKENKEK